MNKRKFTYKNEAAYLEAWKYLASIGCGFSYHRDELYVIPDIEDEAIFRRLEDIGR